MTPPIEIGAALWRRRAPRATIAAVAIAGFSAGPAAAAPGDLHVLAGGPGYGSADALSIAPQAMWVASDRLVTAEREGALVRDVDLATRETSVLAGVGLSSGSDEILPTPLPDGSVPLRDATAVTVAPDGTVYAAQVNAIKRIDPDGTVTTFAGIEGRAAATGDFADGQPATATAFTGITGLALADDGALLVLESGRDDGTAAGSGHLRRIGTHGTVSTLAGGGDPLQAGASGAAGEAYLRRPSSLALAPDGDVLIAERGLARSSRRHWNGNRIRRLDAGADEILQPTDTIDTIAGPTGDSSTNGASGGVGDGGQATVAKLDVPRAVVALAGGGILVGEAARVRHIAEDGTITTLAGGGSEAPIGAEPSGANLTGLQTIATDGDRLFISVVSGGYAGVVKTDVEGGADLSPGAGNGRFVSGDDGSAATNMQFRPAGVAVAPDGTIYAADSVGRIVRVHAATGELTRVYGDALPCALTGCGENGPARETRADSPADLILDPQGRLYFTESGGARVRRIDTTAGPDPDDWTVETVVGTGTPGTDGDGGPATEANIDSVRGLAVSADGNTLFLGEFASGAVRAVDLTTGVIDHYAGTLLGEGVTEGGDARNAVFGEIVDLAMLPGGDLLVASQTRLTRVDAERRAFTFYARPQGEPAIPGVPEIGGNVTAPELSDVGPISAIATRADGTIAISNGTRIWLREPGGPLVRLLAGAAQDGGYNGTAGKAWDRLLSFNDALSFAADGSLLFVDHRRVFRSDAVDPQLRIDGVSPSGLVAGGPEVVVRIDSGRTLGPVVVSGGDGIDVTATRRDGPTQIVATLRAAATTQAGPRDLRLTTADGASVVAARALTVTAAAPVPVPVADAPPVDSTAPTPPAPLAAPAAPQSPASIAPKRDITKPRLSQAKVKGKKLYFRLSEAATVRVTINRKGSKRPKRIVRRLTAGARTITVGKLKKGRYTITVVVTDAAGNTGRKTIRLRR